MDIEERAVFVVGMSLVELSCNGAVGGADVVNDLAEDAMDIGYFTKVPCTPVMEKCGALEENEARGAEFARVVAVMEGAGVEPVAVDGSAYATAFLVG